MKKQYVAAFGLVLSASALMADNTTDNFCRLFAEEWAVKTTAKSPIQGNIAPQSGSDASIDELDGKQVSPLRSPRGDDAQTPKKSTSSVQTSSWGTWAYDSVKACVRFVVGLIGF